MDVTIEPFIGLSNANRQPVRFEQYRIRVDGLTAGYVGYQPNAKICLITRFSPIEVEEIEKKVEELTKNEVSGTAQAPKIPPELQKNQTNAEEIIDDDFDS